MPLGHLPTSLNKTHDYEAAGYRIEIEWPED